MAVNKLQALLLLRGGQDDTIKPNFSPATDHSFEAILSLTKIITHH